MSEMMMIAGLGNPGKRYENTRHNMGFKAIDAVAAFLDVNVKTKKFGSLLGRCDYKDKKLILLKPLSFMNCSGQVLATAVGFYKLPIENLLVIVDDTALEPGRIRLRASGSAGGHNGLADIIARLGTENFSRLRIGVGEIRSDLMVDHVLSVPTKEQTPLLNDAIERSREAVLDWIEHGIDAAMNKYN